MTDASPPEASEALAFDVYGTLVDPIRVWTRLEGYAPGDARRVAEIWRQKQLEYAFRLTAMEQYHDFEWVTARALDYALAVTGVTLDAERRAALLAQYDHLEPFSDVMPGLQALRAAGHPMAVFSNGSPRMLGAVLASAGLAAYFDAVVSVDEVGAFKPSPRVYRHVAGRLRRSVERVRLISSNPFDVIGAEAVGMPVAWVNRGGAPFDPVAPPPRLVVASLVELAEALRTGG